jgi:hypothetical protein
MLQLIGQKLPIGSHPSVPFPERPFLAPCRVIFSLQSHSILFPDLTAVSFKALTACCTEATCRRCKIVVRFFAGKDWVYAAVVPTRHAVESQPVIEILNGASEIPRSLRPFIGNPAKFCRKMPPLNNSVEKLDDSDIELMFSAKVEPVVGSYRDADTFPDGILNEGCFFGARSYYG